MPLTAQDWDDELAPQPSTSSRIRRSSSKSSRRGVVIAVVIAVVLAIAGVGAWVFKDSLPGIGNNTSQVAKDPDAGSGDIQEAPASQPAETRDTLTTAWATVTSTGAVQTSGETYINGKRVVFHTTWNLDRSLGSGTMEVDGVTAETKLYKDFPATATEPKKHGVLVHNANDVLTPLLGKNVALRDWVLINADSEFSLLYPALSVAGTTDQPTVQIQGQAVPATNETVTVKGGHIEASLPQLHIDVASVDASAVAPLGEGFQLEGKLEKDAQGSWKVLRYKR